MYIKKTTSICLNRTVPLSNFILETDLFNTLIALEELRRNTIIHNARMLIRTYYLYLYYYRLTSWSG